MKQLDACPDVPDSEATLVRLRGKDVSLLTIAVAETMEALQDCEFELRVGVPRSEFRDLLDRMIALGK